MGASFWVWGVLGDLVGADSKKLNDSPRWNVTLSTFNQVLDLIRRKWRYFTCVPSPHATSYFYSPTTQKEMMRLSYLWKRNTWQAHKTYRWNYQMGLTSMADTNN